MTKYGRTQTPQGTRSRSRLGEQPHSRVPDEGEQARGRLAMISSRVAALVLVVASILFLRVLFTGGRFQVQRLTVSGNHLVDAAELQAAANVVGHSIFQVQPDLLEAQLLDRFGSIAQVRVTCRLPDEVRVVVRERTGMLAWESGGRYWWVAADGESLGEASGPGDLVVIHDISGVAPDPMGYIVGPPWDMIQGLQTQLPNVREYDYSQDYGVVMRVGDQSWPVYLGQSGDLSTKIAVVQALVNTLARQGVDVEYVDMRNDARPTFKKRG